MVLDLPKLERLPDIRTTDRSDARYLGLRGIRPERMETDQDGVLVSVYANNERIRETIREYWQDVRRKIYQAQEA